MARALANMFLASLQPIGLWVNIFASSESSIMLSRIGKCGGRRIPIAHTVDCFSDTALRQPAQAFYYPVSRQIKWV
jgi:hypothetical protein